MKNYNVIVLGGGGVKCISTLGALQYIYDNSDIYTHVKTFIGTSAGAIISLLLAIGYTPIEITVYICTHNVLGTLLPFDFFSLMKGLGALKFERLETHLRDMVEYKTGKREFTLLELYERFNKVVICTSYNLTNNSCEYISYKTYPSIDCVTAVRASASIPFVFDECIINNNVYVDGGIVDNFPIHLCKDPDIVFGCVIFTKYNNLDTQYRILSILRVLSTLSSNFYIKRLLKCSNSLNKDIIEIDLQDIDIFDFDKHQTSILSLYTDGYNKCLIFFTNNVNETNCQMDSNTNSRE